MHEYGIVQSLIQSVEREAAAREATAVHQIRVRLGELSGVDPELFALAYETFREQTVCAGARMEITPVAASWDCPVCDRPIARGATLVCPHCQTPARLRAGAEIILDRIEMEVRDV